MITRNNILGMIALAACWVAALGATETYELPDYQPQNPYVDSVRFALMGLKDARFYSRGTRRGVNVLTNEPATKFTYKVWLQDQPAPLVMLLPGLGGHCASLAPTVLAESLFSHGLSVLVVSSPFNWEFVLNGSSMVTPGYTPQDACDMYAALQAVKADIDKTYPAKITRHLLVGYSLGGLEALFIAELDAREQKFKFDRVLAINPPVNLLYGLKQLDDSYQTWTNWTKANLEAKKNTAVNFYDKHMRTPLTAETIGTNGVLPFAGDEAALAMGMVFRRSLGEVIKAIHQRRNYGLLDQKYESGRTRFLEKEIERYGYANYMMTFVKASYSNLWSTGYTSKDLNKMASLPAITPFLASNLSIRVLHTRDDFLLTDYDREWLGRVLGDRVSFLDHGGHLGFLYRANALEFIAWQLGHGVNPLVKVGASGSVAFAAASITSAPAASVTAASTTSVAIVATATGTVTNVVATVVAGGATNAPAPPVAATPAPIPAISAAPPTVATIEMADEGITKTAVVVRAMPVSAAATNAVAEYIDRKAGVLTNDHGITIEFNGE